jgi:hypothetical protein
MRYYLFAPSLAFPSRQAWFVEDQQGSGGAGPRQLKNRLVPKTRSRRDLSYKAKPYSTCDASFAAACRMNRRIIPSHVVVVCVLLRGECQTHKASVILLARALAYPSSPSTAHVVGSAKVQISRSCMFAARRRLAHVRRITPVLTS